MKKALRLLSLMFLASCAVRQNSTVAAFAPNPVVAHRGAFKAHGYPENSIASLKEAIRLQCTGSEFDVRMTADDSLVINHDPHYNKLEIEKTTYSELASHKLSNGETLPTLRQYLQAGLQNNQHTRLVLEIKPTSSKERARLLAERVVAMVKALNAAPMTLYISFDYDILKRVIEVAPGAPTQYLNGDVPPEQLKADGISGADYHFSVFQKHPEWIGGARQNGIALNAWTVNEEKDMRWLLDSGFNYITTNEPELLLEVAKSMGRAKK
ncbi:MAG TPA: glycerophosphodiester phosphodiesterase family protein [Flavisolibacter sp.]|nr:glycerophosphodiester phosphodiesterase family protein [Flavisolibacter sp.]